MTIEDVISKSAEFEKLLTFFNTPINQNSGELCTIKGTTIDIQKIILSLISNTIKKSLVYSNLSTINIINYFNELYVIDNINFKVLNDLLEKKAFSRTNKVDNYGEYSILGDTITFWPSIYEKPIRCNFFGEEIEDIEMIDEVYRNKISDINEIMISDEKLLEDDVERQSIKIINPGYKLSANKAVFTNKKHKKIEKRFIFDFTYTQLFFTRFDLLQSEIEKRKDWIIKISTEHEDRLNKSLKKYTTNKIYHSGFESSKLKLAVYTDRELFGTIFISKEKSKVTEKVNRYLAQLEGEIEIGDYIVHEDYGIAIYRGILQKKVLEHNNDYLILEYAQGDKLSVPISQVNKLTKYIGPDEAPPKITRLGKTSWNTIKRNVKKKVMVLARELLRHYAKAELADVDSFGKHEGEDEFAENFEFVETEDQLRAIQELLYDLEKQKPMNRLLVGDVGFGKTEVAIRGAFRTAMNGKQVAVLCPTTILVSQHFSVFKHRMRNYPINIKTLSRFGTKKENQKIVKELQEGKVDIIIGTHRLLSNDIKFKNLGLLVIDEEQKFGVAQKEKIKKIAYHSNVLSMSATPIPRTLSMALSKLRDISLITTPPPGRKSIDTKLEYFTWSKAADVILKEVRRGGQVYFIHNEVRTIESIKSKLEKILPDVRFKIGHGQMHPLTLDKTMREFYQGKFDCLICTTIIENGIDIKNVNTIIINKAQNFGLAQLYQLRGRVGRSEKQAFCHLFYNIKDLFKENPVYKELRLRGKKVPLEKAKARLEAILESDELGSGFKVASRDLEIRGAGNLLGGEQHGNISKVGLGLYTQLLSDEVEKLKKSMESQSGSSSYSS